MVQVDPFLGTWNRHSVGSSPTGGIISGELEVVDGILSQSIHNVEFVPVPVFPDAASVEAKAREVLHSNR